MNKMTKSEVYSWRLSRELKMQLEAAAREGKIPLSALLERLAREWLDKQMPDDSEHQRRLHERARRAIGTVSIGGASATNQRVREVMGEALEKKYRASLRSLERTARRSD
jgi:hypothetical protein